MLTITNSFHIAITCYILLKGEIKRTFPELPFIREGISYPGTKITRNPEAVGETIDDMKQHFTPEHLKSLPSSGVLFFYADVIKLAISADVNKDGDHCAFLPFNASSLGHTPLIHEIPEKKKFAWVQMFDYKKEGSSCKTDELELVYVFDLDFSGIEFQSQFIVVTRQDKISQLVGYGRIFKKRWRDQAREYIERRLVVLE